MRLADLASILAQGCTLWTDSFKLSGTPARSGGFRFYNEAAAQIGGQFDQLLDHLVGKPVSSVSDLYLPGQIADDTDVSSGATVRAPKVISAIWDALGRHAYTIIR